MQVARLGAGQLFDVREERDDVVARALFDLEHAARVELSVHGAGDAIGDARGHATELLHRAASGELDGEPGLDLGLFGKECSKSRSAVAV